MRVDVQDVSPGLGKQAINSVDGKRESRFLITVSTNFRPKTTEESMAMAQQLRTAVRQLLTEENIPRMLDFHEGGPSDLKKVKAEFNVELGKLANGKRIHSHIYLEFKHNAMIRINIPASKQMLLGWIDDFRVKSLYFNVKMIRSGVRSYLRKEGYNPGGIDAAASDVGSSSSAGAGPAAGDDLSSAFGSMSLGDGR